MDQDENNGQNGTNDEDQGSPIMLPPQERQDEGTGQSKPQSPEVAKKQLKHAVQASQEVIAEATTFLQLFPLTITLDRAKLEVSKNMRISTTAVVSLPIKDVLNVSAEVGPFLGKVTIDKKILTKEDPFHFGPFRRKDAMNIAIISQGYVIALQRGIDVSGIPIEELRDMLRELGKDVRVDPGDTIAKQ